MNFILVISPKQLGIKELMPHTRHHTSFRLGHATAYLGYNTPLPHNFRFFQLEQKDGVFSLHKGWLWQETKVSSLLDTFAQNPIEGDYFCSDMDTRLGRLRLACSPNHTAKAYYHWDGQTLLVSDKLHWISSAMRAMGTPPSMDRTSAYSLLTLGHTYQERTFLKDVHRLRGGELLTLENGNLKLEDRHPLDQVSYAHLNLDEFIDALQESFVQGIRAEYDNDLKDRAPTLTLSGGLDSRMNLMYALQEDHHPKAICFGQSGSQDHSIALEVARRLTVPLEFTPLENSLYPLDIEQNTLMTEGQTFYLGSAHLRHTLLGTQAFGMLHTGLIGDGVLGGFCSAPHHVEASLEKKCMSTVYVDKLKDMLIWNPKDFRCEESFCMQNRVYNHAYSGIWITEPHGVMTSPFMSWQFIKLCMTIPPDLKYRQGIYLKWIERYQPRMFDFEWETIGAKPSSDIERNLRMEKIQAAKRKAAGLLKLDAKTSMNPYEYWWRNKPQLREGMDSYLDQHLDLLPADDKELKEDVRSLYTFGSFIEKSLAISLLAAYKLHMG